MSFPSNRFAVVFGGVSPEHDLNIFGFRYLYEEYLRHSSSNAPQLTTAYYITREGDVRITPVSPNEPVEFYLDNDAPPVPLLQAFCEMQRANEFVFVLVDDKARFPGVADLFGISGNFGSILANAVAVSKTHLNQLVEGQYQDIFIPETRCVISSGEVGECVPQLGDSEVVVKPNSLGSSLFVERFGVDDINRIAEHVEQIIPYDREVLIQQRIRGREFTCYLLERECDIEVIGVKELITPNGFFGTREKYHLNQGVEYQFFPYGKQHGSEIERIMAFSRCLAKNIGLRNMSRLDFIVDADGAIFFLEANTNPSIRPYQEAVNSRYETWSVLDLVKTFMHNEAARGTVEVNHRMLVEH